VAAEIRRVSTPGRPGRPYNPGETAPPPEVAMKGVTLPTETVFVMEMSPIHRHRRSP